MNILVTDSTYKHSLGIVRALGKINIKPFILSYKNKSLCSYSKYSNQEIIISPEFEFEEILNMLQINNIELIIIVGTSSFMKIVPWKYKLKKFNIHMITVDQDKLDSAFSKKEMYTLAQSLKVPIATTYYPQQFDDLVHLKNKISFPCVIKGLYEVGGNIVDYAYTAEELEFKYQKICDKYSIRESDGIPMLQEYITGRGCAFFAVYNNGKCGLTFQHKRIREYPVSGGASVCAESYKNDLVEEYGKKLLDKLNWHGVAMVEFKLNDKNIPVLMEINPKFWGSIDLALEAGVNFPKALIDIYKGKDILYSNSYKVPFKYHWPMHGDILHGIKNPKAIPSIVIDTFNPKVKSNLWLSDIKPTFKMILSFIRSLIINLMKRTNV